MLRCHDLRCVGLDLTCVQKYACTDLTETFFFSRKSNIHSWRCLLSALLVVHLVGEVANAVQARGSSISSMCLKFEVVAI